jgi:phosphate-selective porin OprO/OprP
MKHNRIFLGIAALAATVMVPCPVLGQDVVQQTVPGKEASAEKTAEKESGKTEHDWGFRWDGRPSLHLGEGTRVDFRVRIQSEIWHSDASLSEPDDDSDADNDLNADVARRRIGIEGEILNIFDYQVERELTANRDPWRDVYLNYKQYAFAEVMAGKFKVPFSLDENTSSTNLDFVNRSRIATLLAPGRDVGVMVHGRFLTRGILRYELGLFDEDGSNADRNDTDFVHGDRTVAGRLLAQPFRSTKSVANDLAVGVSFTTSELPEGVSGLRGRTELDEWFYRPEVLVNGRRQRIGVEARWRPGPFSIKSEFIRLTDERLGESIEGTDLSPFLGQGWYVSGTWAVTGEKKAEGLDAPLRPLFRGPFFKGWVGAVELAARAERIRFGSVDSDISGVVPSTAPRAEIVLGNSDLAYTFGVNWYANRWIKVQLNLVRNTIGFPDQGPNPEQSSFWSRIVRFQFSM